MHVYCTTTAAEHAAARPAVQPAGGRRPQGRHAQSPEEPDTPPPAAEAAEETGLYRAHNLAIVSPAPS